MWKKLELEWKIIILAAGLVLLLAWPLQIFLSARLQTTLEQSIDPGLETLLRSKADTTDAMANRELVVSLERHRQWQAMIPIMVREQQVSLVIVSVFVLLGIILLAVWVLKRLTRPLKNLSQAAEGIGMGLKVGIVLRSGGALGKLEQAMDRMQQELEHLREHEQARGMEEAWRDIARVMAHEIKNPLTPIRLTLDRLEEKVAQEKTVDPAELQTALERITAQVENLERLVNAFRSFAREPEARIRAITLRAPLAAAATGMQHALATTIEGDARIAGDPHLLEQAFLNLWKNAYEAGATTMRVRISTDQAIARVDIKDNGPGIDPDKVDKVWVPYVTFKKGGTGLGLPVVKRIIESLHGSIALRSVQGSGEHGVTVIITFPLQPKDNTHE